VSVRFVIRLGIATVLTLALAPLATAGAQSPPKVSEEPAFRVVEIVPPPGLRTPSGSLELDTSVGAGINESGQVVGWLQNGTIGTCIGCNTGTGNPFVWDPSTGLRVLGYFTGRNSLTGEPQPLRTRANGINDRGEVTGTATTGRYYDDPTAFRWTSSGGYESLGTGDARGINNNREVSGIFVSPTRNLGPFPVKWDANGELLSLGSLGGTHGAAYAINDGGRVVGYSRNAQSYARPFLWDSQTGIRDLSTFFEPDDSTAGGVAWGVNDLGHVVGTTDDPTASLGGSRAFLWRDGQLTRVGPDRTDAYAVNNHDHVVGSVLVPPSRRRRTSEVHAFLYRDGTFSDLNNLIPTDSGILLTEPRSINDAGWIVANGTNAQGRQRSFVLIPR
jgi:probable HAF family extracellular repeat protein